MTVIKTKGGFQTLPKINTSIVEVGVEVEVGDVTYYKCSECNKKCRSKRLLEKHYNIYHNNIIIDNRDLVTATIIDTRQVVDAIVLKYKHPLVFLLDVANKNY